MIFLKKVKILVFLVIFFVCLGKNFVFADNNSFKKKNTNYLITSNKNQENLSKHGKKKNNIKSKNNKYNKYSGEKRDILQKKIKKKNANNTIKLKTKSNIIYKNNNINNNKSAQEKADLSINNSSNYFNNREENIKENELKLNIGGMADFEYANINQSDLYEKNSIKQLNRGGYYLINGSNNKVNVSMGKIDINPEFSHYKKTDDFQQKKIVSVGFKLSQPFKKGYKNKDFRFAQQEFIYLKTKYIQFQAGAVNSAASSMRVDAQNIASGNGGVYSNWQQYATLPFFNASNARIKDISVFNFISPTYILYPTLPNEAGFTSKYFFNNANSFNGIITGQGYATQGAYSNKISMYVKRIKGFGFGISYSPTTANTGYITRMINDGSGNIFKNISGGFVRNYTSFAIDYRKQLDRYGIGVAGSFTYEHGDATSVEYKDKNFVLQNCVYNRHDLNAFAIGGQIVYKNYAFAYSYGYWGKSLLNKYLLISDEKYHIPYSKKTSYYHTFGATYSNSFGFFKRYGVFNVGPTFMQTSFAGYKLDVWTMGTDFTVTCFKRIKIKLYTQYTGYIFHNQDFKLNFNNITETYKAVKNRGYVITTGINVVF